MASKWAVKEYIGEALGTFILVFIGCGTVGVAMTTDYFQSLISVAFCWGAGVTLAILVSSRLCPAHLNPIVSVASRIWGTISSRQLYMYSLSQLAGAFAAGGALFTLFDERLQKLEASKELTRGLQGSQQSAMMFGEFFPNPGFPDIQVSHMGAFLGEFIGSFILLCSIYYFTRPGKLQKWAPLLIGLTITTIIVFLAPYTQAGINPARDLGPRLVAYLSGWKSAALTTPNSGVFSVYILAPILAGVLSGFLFRPSHSENPVG